MSGEAPHGSLLLPFDNDNPRFVDGVEIGRLWEIVKRDYDVVETVHARNAEMVMRIAEATGRKFSAEHVDDTWIVVTLSGEGAMCAACGEYLHDCTCEASA